jgi:ribose transport system substrate-binding protein
MTKKIDIIRPSRRGLLKTGAALAGLSLAAPYIARSAFAQSGLAGKKVGYSMSFSTIEWLVAQRRGVTETAAKFDFDVTVADAADRPTQQVQDLEDFITKRMDLIIVSTYYAEAITPAIKEINEAGIPLVVLSSSLVGDSDWTCRLAADNLGTAHGAGKYYVDKLGTAAKVVQIEGKTGSVVNQERSKGWREEVEKAGIQIVGHGVANYERSQALRKMEDFLQAQREINAVYCNNDDMALGALQAAKEAGRNEGLMITGYDGIQPEMMAAIHAGDIHGTWQYTPMGVEGVEVAAKILQGETVPKEILFQSPLITKENVTEIWDESTNEMKPFLSQLKI